MSDPALRGPLEDYPVKADEIRGHLSELQRAQQDLQDDSDRLRLAAQMVEPHWAGASCQAFQNEVRQYADDRAPRTRLEVAM